MRKYLLLALLLPATSFAQLAYTASGYWLCEHVDGSVTRHVVDREAWQECGNEALRNPGTELIVTPPQNFRVSYDGPAIVPEPEPLELVLDYDCVPLLTGLSPSDVIDLSPCLSGSAARTVSVDSTAWTVTGETLTAPVSGSGTLTVTVSIDAASIVTRMPWSVL